MVLFLRLVMWTRRSRRAGLLLVLGMVSLAIVGNAACFYYFDGPHNPDLGIDDALWYSVISITTIGYGDFSAQSLGARLATVLFVVVIGLTSFTLLLGIFADTLMEFVQKGQRGMTKILHENHTVIVNFPSRTRVQQLIRELGSDPENKAQQIVVLTDTLDTLPFSLPNVSFVNGSPLEEESFDRANLGAARFALVLAPDYDDSRSDAVVASIVSFIESFRPGVRTVAECIDEKHRILFSNSQCDAIVCGTQISSNLLSQEMHDPGVAQTMGVITSNLITPTLFSTRVSDGDPIDYTALAKSLLDKDANVLSVIRADETHTTFSGLRSTPDDRVVYIAERRFSWSELRKLA